MKRLVLAATITALVVVTHAPATAQTAGPVDPALIEDLVAASRILADQGVLDAFGHVSVRHPANPNRYLMTRNLAPALVTAKDIVEYDLDSNPVDPGAPAGFLERHIHGQIYRLRPDVNAVVHTHSPSVIPFGVSKVPMQPVYHMAAFLYPGVPVFEIRKAAGMTGMLITSAALGQALAQTLGDKPMALMRGHGNVVVGPNVQVAVMRAVYTEVNARLQSTAMGLGGEITFLEKEEGEKATPLIEGQVARPWNLWKQRVMSAR